MDMDQEELFTVSQAAAAAGVTEATVYRWLNTGLLVPVRVAGNVVMVDKTAIRSIGEDRRMKRRPGRPTRAEAAAKRQEAAKRREEFLAAVAEVFDRFTGGLSA